MFLRKLFFTVLASCLLLSVLPAQDLDTPYTCFPSCGETDGRFLALAGEGLITQGGDFININIIATGASFQIGLFDGDTGAGAVPHWDRVPPAELGLTMMTYKLFADPTGDGVGIVPVGPVGGWLSNVVNPQTDGSTFSSTVNGAPTGEMPDNDWFDIDITNVAAAAAVPGFSCPPGAFCYRLLVNLNNPNGSTESSFKFRTTGDMRLRPLAFSIVAPFRNLGDRDILYPQYPDTSLTTYDGSWRFVMDLAEPSSFFTIWDGDFDYGAFDCLENDSDDPDTCLNMSPGEACILNSNPAAGFLNALVPPWADATFSKTEGIGVGNPSASALCAFNGGRTTGAPPDDRDPSALGVIDAFRRGPSVFYRLTTPDGTQFVNPNPSGNQEWEQFRLDTDLLSPADFHVAEIPAGEYVLELIGLDLSNLNALRMSADVVGVPSASIGDRVWFDTLRPEDGGTYGFQDAGEVGINGVTVRLYRDSNLDGILDPGVDELLGEQVTSGDGDYDFLGVGQGAYFVDVVESTLPAGVTLTTANEPYLPGGPYNLATGEDHDDADFGYVLGTIGDFVWQDNNMDGIFQPELGEIGIDNVEVVLIGDVDGDGTVDTISTFTNASGFYLFDGIAIDDYTVVVAASNFAPDGPLEGSTQTFDFDGLLDNQTDVSLTASFPDGFEFLDADFGYFRACGECEGKVTEMTMRYLGSQPAFIEVVQKKGEVTVFAGTVQPLEYFSFAGVDSKGTLSTEVRLFVNGSLNAAIHTSCSQPIGPGLIAGDFLVAEAFSRNGGLICPLEVPGGPGDPPGGCNECDGKVTELTLRYDGPTATLIVRQGGDVIFDDVVPSGQNLTVFGTDKKGTLGKEIKIFRGGNLIAKIHTSCSQPIGPGVVEGDFTVVESFSRNGGRVCPVDNPPPPPSNCNPCDGKVTELELKYLGPDDDVFIQVFQKKRDLAVFEGTLNKDERFVFEGRDKAGTFGTEIRIYINGELDVAIHTSCSQPIGPDMIFGSFRVEEAYSRNGGRICPN